MTLLQQWWLMYSGSLRALNLWLEELWAETLTELFIKRNRGGPEKHALNMQWKIYFDLRSSFMMQFTVKSNNSVFLPLGCSSLSEEQETGRHLKCTQPWLWPRQRHHTSLPLQHHPRDHLTVAVMNPFDHWLWNPPSFLLLSCLYSVLYPCLPVQHHIFTLGYVRNAGWDMVAQKSAEPRQLLASHSCNWSTTAAALDRL